MQDALNGPDRKLWLNAVCDEIKSLIANDTWSLVEKPQDAKIIGCRTVLRYKYNSDGTISRRKARVVAQGFSQIAGVDFTDTYAPVARLDSLRLLAAIAAKIGLKLYQLDITSAYLNGEIDKELYMKTPENFREALNLIIATENDAEILRKTKRMLVDLENGRNTCKLNKALYGLRQAGRQWNCKLNQVLSSIGLKPTESDPCLYVDTKDDKTFVLVYVDDLIMASDDPSRVQQLKEALSAHFQVKDLGTAKFCLGLEFEQYENEITLCQSGYIRDVLAKFNMTNCKPVATPLVVGSQLEPYDGKEGDTTELPYRELIGALMYISIGTRPDITHAVNRLSQFNSCYGRSHWEAAKRILRYLKGTIERKLVYHKDDKALSGFADADWGNDPVDRRSYTGYVFICSGAAVSWCSRKQRTVALSSTEAEYMSLTEAAKECIYLSSLLKELGLHSLAEIILYNDNQSAGKLARNPVFHARSKHIPIKMHFIRNALQQEQFRLEYLSTGKMVADVLTKALPKPKFEFCAIGLGLN